MSQKRTFKKKKLKQLKNLAKQQQEKPRYTVIKLFKEYKTYNAKRCDNWAFYPNFSPFFPVTIVSSFPFPASYGTSMKILCLIGSI